MSCKRIRDIQQRLKKQVIEIRVLRKWIPLVKKNEVVQKTNELCYLFVDVHGDAIEASADADEVEYYDSIIKLSSCYRVTGFICTNRRPYMSTVNHEASLIIGKKAQFDPIPGLDIPTVYFNFATYEQLNDRVKDNKILTDYIGRVESNYLRPTTKNIVPRKTMLQDQWQKSVEIILWPQMQHLYGDEVKEGDIIAITSAAVTNHEGLMQLESTYLTTVVINPDLPQTASHVERLKKMESIPKSDTVDITLNVNQLNPKNLLGNKRMIRCKCYAKITKIFEQRGWYYAQCSKCTNKLYPEEDESLTFSCKDHDDIDPKLKYSLNVLIADNTGTEEVVFFDEGMTALIKKTCQDLVFKKRCIDPKILPQEIRDITKDDNDMLFLLTVKNKQIVVDNVLKINESSKNVGTSSQSENEDLPPQTPNPKVNAVKRPLHDTPGI
ncbi:hypothetical protein M8C21_031806 [Ambrosia artemisiifolia]|uniref:Replication factor A C-terminal domain-containing protein n=1 Tax=Ambrosia artemisiifolia TaxID=4212 RepID=A0AAD5CD26_AMBAR|nr:hypothetical protein M8C21_031806 [Ambrosia artemisiifolia]